jgi:hypothetical protein
MNVTKNNHFYHDMIEKMNGKIEFLMVPSWDLMEGSIDSRDSGLWISSERRW